jgi:DNA-binding Lrp family transcriptional regulator
MHALEASRIVTDDYSVRILVATLDKPRTAVELSRRLGIPIAACYRRIRVLERNHLLKPVTMLNEDDKRITAYSALLRNAYIFFEDGVLKARFEFVNGTIENYSLDWEQPETL